MLCFLRQGYHAGALDVPGSFNTAFIIRPDEAPNNLFVPRCFHVRRLPIGAFRPPRDGYRVPVLDGRSPPPAVFSGRPTGFAVPVRVP